MRLHVYLEPGYRLLVNGAVVAENRTERVFGMGYPGLYDLAIYDKGPLTLVSEPIPPPPPPPEPPPLTDDFKTRIAEINAALKSLPAQRREEAFETIMDGICKLCGADDTRDRPCYCAPGYDE